MIMERSRISEVQVILFKGKQNIDWRAVEFYLKSYIGRRYVVSEYGDEIQIGSEFPDEYTGSRYSKSLRGGIAKTKANAASIIGRLIENATNRRVVENKKERHSKDASKGWYRYDTCFSVPVQGEDEPRRRFNFYRGTLVVRRTLEGNYLYDMVNIKKEARKPSGSS